MGMLRRSPVNTRRPGRRPYAYALTRWAKRYLEWLRGPGLVDAFEAFAAAGYGNCVPAGERLLRRLRVFEGERFDRPTMSLLGFHLDLLRQHPSLEVYCSALRIFASFVIVATGDASVETMVRVHKRVFPYVLGSYVVVSPEGTPLAKSFDTLDQAIEISSLWMKSFEAGLVVGARGVEVAAPPGTVQDPNSEESLQRLKAQFREAEASFAMRRSALLVLLKSMPREAALAAVDRWVATGTISVLEATELRDRLEGRFTEDRPGAPNQGGPPSVPVADTPDTRRFVAWLIHILARGQPIILRYPRLDVRGKPVLDEQGRPLCRDVFLNPVGADLESLGEALRRSSGDAGQLLNAIIRAFSARGPPVVGSAGIGSAHEGATAPSPSARTATAGAVPSTGPDMIDRMLQELATLESPGSASPARPPSEPERRENAHASPQADVKSPSAAEASLAGRIADTHNGGRRPPHPTQEHGIGKRRHPRASSAGQQKVDSKRRSPHRVPP